MHYLIRVTISPALLVCASLLACASSAAQAPKESGTITGRVTLDGRPAQGVIVMGTSSSPSVPAGRVDHSAKPSASPKTTTDADGRYRLEGLPAGTYYITPIAPALVNLAPDKLETQITVTDDAIVERIDFSLTRGGVISGKITDNEGRPVIAALISLNPVGTNYSAGFYTMSRDSMFFTDDRGVYRIFGLPAGRYVVSAGNSENSPFGALFTGQSKVKTYYPGVTDEPMARPVEVSAGAEALGVDIKLGAAAKAFAVSGRVVEAGTRKPVGNAMVAYGRNRARKDAPDRDVDDDDDDNDIFGDLGGFTMTNTRGEFRFESVQPGRYQARTESFAQLTGATEYYADPIGFEVRAANLDNVEITVNRGASITGVVAIENTAGPEPLGQVAQLILIATIQEEPQKSFFQAAGRVLPDGSFRIGGLKGGKAVIIANPTGDGPGFSIVRVERNGVEQHNGIVIQPNEQITGVRVVLVQANCLIRGHVALPGGSPPGSTFFASARSTISPHNPNDEASPVDENGNFVIEGLAPGNYEIEVICLSTNVKPPKQLGSAKQNVTVVSGTPAEVNLVLDLSTRERER